MPQFIARHDFCSICFQTTPGSRIPHKHVLNRNWFLFFFPLPHFLTIFFCGRRSMVRPSRCLKVVTHEASRCKGETCPMARLLCPLCAACVWAMPLCDRHGRDVDGDVRINQNPAHVVTSAHILNIFPPPSSPCRVLPVAKVKYPS